MAYNSTSIDPGDSLSLPVLTDDNGSGTKTPGVKLIDATAGSVAPVGVPTNPLPVSIYSGLVPQRYDEIAMGYTSGDLTSVIYKLGGVTVATLTLSYTGADLTGVVRS